MVSPLYKEEILLPSAKIKSVAPGGSRPSRPSPATLRMLAFIAEILILIAYLAGLFIAWVELNQRNGAAAIVV